MISIAAKVSVKDSGSSEWQLKSDANSEMTLAQLLIFTKTSLIKIARDVLDEEQAKGFDKNPTVVVDGKVGKPVREVKPFGKIQFISTKVMGTKIILDAYKAIMERSKIVTGTYIEAHFVYLNGNLVAQSAGSLAAWLLTYNPSPKDVVRIVNVVPYARKLERLGVTAQRTKRKRVKSRDRRERSGSMILGPNGAYFLAQRAIARMYKYNVGIYFGFVKGDSLPNEGWPTSDKLGRPFRRTYKTRARPKDTGAYMYPSIKIKFWDKGAV